MTRAAILSIVVAGCAVGGSAEHLSSTQGESFDEFRADTYHEDWDGGLYIVDGDTPVLDDKALYEFWQSQQQGALIVNVVGGNDDRWNDQQKHNLTYCVSNAFGSNKAAVVAAMKEATETVGWETMADVNFTYASAEDASCTTSNTNVTFGVRFVSNQPYLARSFFPSSPKSARELNVDATSFQQSDYPLSRIVGHELGHILGFRHEHTRPEAGTCFEDNNWRPLTPYDSKSIMHYPQCNGGSTGLDWSASDRTGAASLYGAPGSGSTTPPAGGTAKSETKSGSVAKGASQSLPAYAVKPGTTFSVTMTGTGDPDLYVRWDSAPTTTTYNCRPYIAGADEQCSVTVPASTSKAYVMVNGYAAATYRLQIDWTAP